MRREELKIVWPGAKQTASGPDERSCEPLAMFAMLFPEKLADAAMAEVVRMANDPVPLSERPARIAALGCDRARRGRPSIAVGAAAGSSRRQDRGACFARRMKLNNGASLPGA